MRIISGSARGRRLLAPKGNRTRPTSDRVKESLFNILTVLKGDFAGKRVLDLFAGTGNLGIEALSRGADHAVFIDDNREAAALVRKNLALAGYAERGRVLHKDVLAALKLLNESGASFGIVFIDPPYGMGLSAQVLEFLSASAIIDEQSVIVAETAAREELSDSFGMLREFDKRVYGDTALTFYRLQ